MNSISLKNEQYPNRAESKDFKSRLEFVLNISARGDVSLFSEITDISTSTLRTYLRGDSEPSLGKLASIALNSGVQIEWLTLGTGPIYCETTLVPIVTLKEACEVIHKEEEANLYNRERRNVIDNLHIRPDLLQEQFGLHPNDILIAHHEGYSMAGTLNQGDMLLLDRVSITPTHGLYLVSYSDGYDVRRLMRHPDGSLTIGCDNDKYPTFTLTKSQLTDSDIKVLAKIRHSWKARDM